MPKYYLRPFLTTSELVREWPHPEEDRDRTAPPTLDLLDSWPPGPKRTTHANFGDTRQPRGAPLRSTSLIKRIGYKKSPVVKNMAQNWTPFNTKNTSEKAPKIGQEMTKQNQAVIDMSNFQTWTGISSSLLLFINITLLSGSAYAAVLDFTGANSYSCGLARIDSLFAQTLHIWTLSVSERTPDVGEQVTPVTSNCKRDCTLVDLSAQ
ncbi:hypothetical protein HGM15179_015290 [Zosterops borbonicus]|uniref:Uncharacterized protein n=1 Tax=Zosterops borbonicus TaxID=364589 RepID=A0A8K1G505_9PASS|nr:hypothetical protein HGM15179_015290 [Zosterops borbonicus]